MRPLDDTALARDGKVLILAYDHGLEHGPSDFEDLPERMDPGTIFEAATHDAVTALAVQKGIAEAYYPSYERDVSLLAKLNGTSNLWMGEPDSAVNCSVEYAAEIGADVAKVKYPGSREAMERTVRAAGPTEVIMSGGSKVSDEAFLENVKTVMDAGGAGLAVGRNVWQRENPTQILDALEQVIFEGAAVDAALET
jgi:DhnA family fructose-bisphosphate aldolase class Ia